MKLYRFPAVSRHSRPARFTFYGQYATIVDTDDNLYARHARHTYRWLRRAGLSVYHAREAIWYAAVEPIVPAHRVTVSNDRQAVAS